eukprot:5174237-Pleurochrysis_carterae.AAC.2
MTGSSGIFTDSCAAGVAGRASSPAFFSRFDGARAPVANRPSSFPALIVFVDPPLPGLGVVLTVVRPHVLVGHIGPVRLVFGAGGVGVCFDVALQVDARLGLDDPLASIQFRHVLFTQLFRRELRLRARRCVTRASGK